MTGPETSTDSAHRYSVLYKFPQLTYMYLDSHPVNPVGMGKAIQVHERRNHQHWCPVLSMFPQVTFLDSRSVNPEEMKRPYKFMRVLTLPTLMSSQTRV